MPFDDDSDEVNQRLKFAAWLGKQPEYVRPGLEKYPDNICYHTMAGGAKLHVWVQEYHYVNPQFTAKFGITKDEPPILVDVLQGKDSMHPGITLKMIPIQRLKHCGCGKFVVPTKAEGDESMRKIEKAIRQFKSDQAGEVVEGLEESYMARMRGKAGEN